MMVLLNEVRWRVKIFPSKLFRRTFLLKFVYFLQQKSSSLHSALIRCAVCLLYDNFFIIFYYTLLGISSDAHCSTSSCSRITLKRNDSDFFYIIQKLLMSLITIALEKKIYALPRNIHSSSLFIIIIIIIWLSYLTLHNVMNFVYIFLFSRYKYENKDDADGMRCVNAMRSHSYENPFAE